MPNRIIKENICKSDSINQLTWIEEVIFYRLIVNCDDFGRLDARPKILKALLFPLKDGVTTSQIMNALNSLSIAGMVQVYEYDQKPYLQLINWGKHQTIRNQKSKYPKPPDIAFNCNQLQADVPVIQSESKSESKSESNNADEGMGDFSFSESVQAVISEWIKYKKEKNQPYKPIGQKKLLAKIQNKLLEFSEEQVLYAITESMVCNYQGIIWDKIKEYSLSMPHVYGGVQGGDKEGDSL